MNTETIFKDTPRSCDPTASAPDHAEICPLLKRFLQARWNSKAPRPKVWAESWILVYPWLIKKILDRCCIRCCWNESLPQNCTFRWEDSSLKSWHQFLQSNHLPGMEQEAGVSRRKLLYTGWTTRSYRIAQGSLFNILHTTVEENVKKCVCVYIHFLFYGI